ncbi:unnamed protein product [Arctogadus glacialis]
MEGQNDCQSPSVHLLLPQALRAMVCGWLQGGPPGVRPWEAQDARRGPSGATGNADEADPPSRHKLSGRYAWDTSRPPKTCSRGRGH